MVKLGDTPKPDLEDDPFISDDNAVADEEGEVEEEEDNDEENEEGNGAEFQAPLKSPFERAKVENLFRRMKTEAVPLRVHDVIVKGNVKTKDYIIERETTLLRDCSTIQELIQTSKVVNLRLRSLDIFDSINITLDSGPIELPGTANVIIEVVESSNPLSGEIGAYTKGETGSSTVEASLKYKNIFGRGDLWDGAMAYGCDHVGEVSAGVYLPARFRGVVSPLTARVYLQSQDWLKFSSFKDRTLGLNVGLVSTRNHDVSYNLGWRLMTDPSHTASMPIRRQLGHGLLSSLKYTFKVDRRNSNLRPTRGFAFFSTTQIGGIAPDSKCLRFFRQELDLRCAIPLGFYNTAVNVGIAGGIIVPWGHGFLSKETPIPDRFFVGGNRSPVCTLGGPMALWGFRTRGLGPTEPRCRTNAPDGESDPGSDFIGGDIAVTAFADLSFDFPLKWMREKGIHGHIFAAGGNVERLSGNAYKNFSYRQYAESFRSAVGAGIVVPTSLFRIELNYNYLLKRFDTDRGQSGFRISFST